MRSIGVVLHEGKTLGQGLEELRMALADAGYADPPWYQVPKSKEAPKKVRRLLDEGVERILVWGGDGTVRRCIDTIVAEDAKVEVAILPAGTANLLAKALSVPIDLHGALDVAINGTPRPIDVGLINGEAFAVMAGTGFDALMIRDADDAKDRLGKLAYIRAGARHLRTTGADVKVESRREEVVRGPRRVRARRQHGHGPRRHRCVPRRPARRRTARHRRAHRAEPRRLAPSRHAGGARPHRLVAARRDHARLHVRRSGSTARCPGSSTAATDRERRSSTCPSCPARISICVPS